MYQSTSNIYCYSFCKTFLLFKFWVMYKIDNQIICSAIKVYSHILANLVTNQFSFECQPFFTVFFTKMIYLKFTWMKVYCHIFGPILSQINFSDFVFLLYFLGANNVVVKLNAEEWVYFIDRIRNPEFKVYGHIVGQFCRNSICLGISSFFQHICRQIANEPVCVIRIWKYNTTKGCCKSIFAGNSTLSLFFLCWCGWTICPQIDCGIMG